MPLTITKVHDPAGADAYTAVYDVACDNSYPSGGYVLTAAMFNRKAIHGFTPIQKGTANRIITYDPSSDPGVLRVWTALGTEAVAATDQSTISCRVTVVGPTV